MDKKLLESYLDNIAESVVDEDKIVTYKSLSKSLGIHVNTAKQLLYTYLTQQKTQNVFPISATYLLAGKLADGSFSITIVNESELESTYPKFVEITSEHVYSIQKGKNVREVNMLCGVDKGMQESSCLVITSSKCVLRPKDEFKKKPESNKLDNKAAIVKALGAEQEKVYVQESNKKDESPAMKELIKSPKKVSPKKQKEKNQANVKKAGGNIANMFAKVAQKNADKPKNVKNEEKPRVCVSDEVLKGVGSEKDKSRPNMFTKTDQKNSEVLMNIPGTKEKNDDNLSSDEDFEIVRSKRKKKSLSKASPKKRKGKKRKRVLINSDSNDSESNDEGEPPQTPVEEEDSESLPAVVVREENENPTESQTLKKRKKRKIVDKMVMHEDGYLETKKEVVFGTDSDDSEEEPKKNTNTKPVAKLKSAAPNAEKKQASLLTFFKKS